MKSAKNETQLLRRALQGNGIFSTISGAAFVIASRPIAEAIGFDYPAVILGIGISLLVFAAGLFRNAARKRVNRLEAGLAVAGDVAWVSVSAVVIALGYLNTAGNWTVAIIADLVLVFAIVQFLGLRKTAANE